MVEHLTREQIAALLDEAGATGEGLAHLETCAECAGEFEAMSRTRMALSGMPDLAAPEGAWERIRAGLPLPAAGGTVGTAGTEAGVPDGAGARTAIRIFRRPIDPRWSPVLTAAAVLVLFLAGLGVGRTLGPPDSTRTASDRGDRPAGSELAGGAVLDPDEAARLAAEYPEYLRSVAGLRALRDGGPTDDQIATDPALAAERIARLDALIEASREALRTAPADPALNDFLFDVVDERASVAGQLDQTIRQASMEY